MKIKLSTGHITIDDNSQEARKIKEGYDFEVEGTGIKIKNKPTEIKNKWQAIKAIENAKTLTELKSILTKYLELE